MSRGYPVRSQAVRDDHCHAAGPDCVTGLEAGLRSAGRLLAGYLPAAVSGLALTAAVLLAAGDNLTVVNGSVQFTRMTGPLLAVLGITWLAGFVVVTWTAGIYAVIVAGRLLGRPVTAAAAIRRVADRWWPSAVLGVLAAVLTAVVFVALATLLALWDAGPGWRWLVFLGFVVLVWVVLYLPRYLLAVPAAALEDLGAWRALGRARRMARGRSARVLAAALVPSAGGALASWLLRLLIGGVVPVSWQSLAGDMAQTVASWLALLIAVSTLTGCYLDQAIGAPGMGRGERADLATVAGHLPDPAPPGWRPPRAAAAAIVALLPAALYAGYPLTGLRSIPQVSDHAVVTSGEPDFAMTLTSGGRVVLAYGNQLIWCQDRDCYRRHTVAIPGKLVRLGIAALPGGAVAVTGWKYVFVGKSSYKNVSGSRTHYDVWRYDLVAVRCLPTGCGSIAQAAVLRRSSDEEEFGIHDAVAARPGGGLAIVDATSASRKTYQQPWQLTLCPDVRCADRHTVPLTTTFTAQTQNTSRLAAVTVAPGDRPVAAVDALDKLLIITCPSAVCTGPRVTSVSGSRLPGLGLGFELNRDFSSRISVAATPLGVPVVAMPAGSGTALVTCQNPACATASVHRIPVGSPGSSPMLTIDQRGQPLIATFDNGWITTADCPNLACAHPVIHRLVRASPGPGGLLDVAAGPDGTPRIAWFSWVLGEQWGLPNILVCDHDCSAG